MRKCVVDASVIVKWVVEEEHSARASALLEYDVLQAPSHWMAEAVNAIWAKLYRGELAADDATERMRLLLRAPVVGVEIAGLMERGFEISSALTMTIYDSLYLALAERLEARLVTADRELIRRAAGDRRLGSLVEFVGEIGGRGG